jgi:hypothetical protein
VNPRKAGPSVTEKAAQRPLRYSKKQRQTPFRIFSVTSGPFAFAKAGITMTGNHAGQKKEKQNV